MNKKDRKTLSKALIKRDWSIIENMLESNKKGSSKFKNTVVNKLDTKKVYIKNGRAYIESKNTLLVIDTKFKVGTYTKKGFKKGLRLSPDLDGLEIKKYDFSNQVDINSKELYTALKKVSNFRGKEIDNISCAGVIFDNNNIVATDSFRMRKTEINTNLNFSGVVSNDAIDILLYDLKGKDINVSISYNEKQIMFSYAGRIVVNNFYTGDFPDYKSIISNNVSGHTISIETSYLKALLTSVKDYNDKVVIDGLVGEMLLKHDTFENKKVDIEFLIPFSKLGINKRYLLESLVGRGDDIKIEFGKNTQSPIMIDGDTLMMPLNL